MQYMYCTVIFQIASDMWLHSPPLHPTQPVHWLTRMGGFCWHFRWALPGQSLFLLHEPYIFKAPSADCLLPIFILHIYVSASCPMRHLVPFELILNLYYLFMSVFRWASWLRSEVSICVGHVLAFVMCSTSAPSSELSYTILLVSHRNIFIVCISA